jgi:hypothetical protein
VENFKLYDPSMLDQETEEHVLPTIEDIAPGDQENLAKDTILQKKYRTTIQGLKGKLQSKEKWSR